MKRILFLLLVLFAAHGFEESAVYEYKVTGNVTNGYLILRVPFNTSSQKVIQITPHEVFSDEYGDYVKLSGEFEYKAIVEVNASPLRFSTASGDIGKFLESTKYVDVTPEVIEKAEEITASAEDDYEKTAEIIKWVFENMKYNISKTGTRRKASEILREMNGVCGDYSILSAALLRAIGIPTKYVEGFLVEDESYVPHAWIEVYINGKWIPADPTNGEFFTKADKIKLVEAEDPSKGSDKIVGVNPVLERKIFITKITESSSKLFNTHLLLAHEKTAPGSYNQLMVTVKNDNPFTVASLVRVFTDEDINLKEKIKTLVVPPYSSRTITFDFNLSSALSPEYVYSFPIVVVTIDSQQKITLQASDDYPYYSVKGIQVTQVNEINYEHPEAKVRINYSEIMKYVVVVLIIAVLLFAARNKNQKIKNTYEKHLTERKIKKSLQALSKED